MADPFLATLALVGGLGWALLIVLAMAHHPTGGDEGMKYMFFSGVAAFAIGVLWWIYILIGWI